MSKVGGHERETLIALIERLDGPNEPVSRIGTRSEYAAQDALLDPAKLAELLAHEGRRLGFDASEDALGIGDIAFSTEPDMSYVRLFRGYGRLVDNWYEWRDLDMPKARALLLKWLQLSDGAREEAERALRGES